MSDSANNPPTDGTPPPTPPPPERPANAIALHKGVWVSPDDVEVTFARSSGPGGQSVNNTATKATLRVSIGAIVGLDARRLERLRRFAGQRLTKDDSIVIHAEEHRSQADNRRAALERLQDLVARAATLPKRRKKTKPSRAAKERRLKAKKEQSEKKQRRRGWD